VAEAVAVGFNEYISPHDWHKRDRPVAMNTFDSNTHFTNPFADVQIIPQLLNFVTKMGVHTPAQKEQFIRDWHKNAKLSVEREYNDKMFDAKVSNFGTSNVSKNDQKTTKYKAIVNDGKHFLLQRFTALDSLVKTLIQLAHVCDTWMSLIPPYPQARAYLEWVKSVPVIAPVEVPLNNVEQDVEEITNSVALVAINSNNRKS